MLQRNVNQIVAATRLASSSKEWVLYQIYLAAYRKRKTYRDILKPRQAILYQEWLLSNKHRIHRIISKRKMSSASTAHRSGFAMRDGEGDEDLTIEKLCHYLEESLKISKNLPG
jgi:hypothetical protein